MKMLLTDYGKIYIIIIIIIKISCKDNIIKYVVELWYPLAE